jgi:hypothetical protein
MIRRATWSPRLGGEQGETGASKDRLLRGLRNATPYPKPEEGRLSSYRSSHAARGSPPFA